MSLGRLSKLLCKYRSWFWCFSLHVYLHIYMSTYSQYWKNKNIEMHFKKYVRKWRLKDVSVILVCLGTFLENAVNIKTCIVLLVFWWMKIKNGSLREGISVTEKVVLMIKLTIVEYRRHRNIYIYIWSTFSDVAGTRKNFAYFNGRSLRSTGDFAWTLSITHSRMLSFFEFVKVSFWNSLYTGDISKVIIASCKA